jgi:hypothetical protein
MHPDEIHGEDPGEDEEISSPQYYAAGVYPGESRKNLEEHVVKACSLGRAQRQKTPEEANKVNYLRTQNAFPAV